MQQEKIEARALPNEQLRLERLRRGWSRAFIAEQIGVADPKTIGRWERGDAFPSAYFLQKLCALFALPAEELGLLHRERSRTLVEHASFFFPQHARTRPAPANALRDPALPPIHTEELIGRACLRAQLKQRLGADGKSVALALNGLPGVGKTALAISLAYDDDLQALFSDGVLWANLGPEADVLEELKRWGRLLEIEESGLAHAESIEDWTRAIHAAIGSRAMLLIIDDAWSCQDALAFKIGGPNCAYVVTTRIPAVALYFAGAGTSLVKPLAEAESLQLLERFVPELVEREREGIRELARAVGGLPLALELLGAYLQTQLCTGQPRRWLAALERLKQPEERLQLVLPRTPLERQMGLPADAPISLHTTIALSYRQLDPTAQRALLALAGSLSRPENFSEEAALAVSGVSLEALDGLLDAGLLASAGQGRYTLHQTIVDFARFQEEQTLTVVPPRVRVLRQARDKVLRVPEKRPGPFRRDEAMVPALFQRPEEIVKLSSS